MLMVNLIRDWLETEGLNYPSSCNEVSILEQQQQKGCEGEKQRMDGGGGGGGVIMHHFPAVQRAADTSCADPHGGAAAFRSERHLPVCTCARCKITASRLQIALISDKSSREPAARQLGLDFALERRLHDGGV